MLLQYLKPQRVDFEPRNRKKGAGKTGRLERRKKGVREERTRDEVKDFVRNKKLRRGRTEGDEDTDGKGKTKEAARYDVFHRFQKS